MMTKKHVVLPRSHLPVRPPLTPTLLALIASEVYHAPGWVGGVVFTLLSLAWIGWGILLNREEQKPLPGYGERGDE